MNSTLMAKQNPNFSLILEMQTVVETRFPLGAINQLAVIKEQNLHLESPELLGYFKALARFGDNIQDSDAIATVDIAMMADITQSIVFGHCGMFCSYLIGYFKPKTNVLIETIFFDNDHQALLIGRSKEQNALTGLIYDPWAKRVYDASELEMMKTQENIAYCYRVMSSTDDYLTQYTKSHYLQGQPQYYTGPDNDKVDEVLVRWVEEDNIRRLESIASANQSNSLLQTMNYNMKTIKSLLTQLSYCEGWSANKSQGKAWLECDSNLQATRIYMILKQSKAMKVERREIQGKPELSNNLIMCTEFDVSKMARLAKALETPQVELLSMSSIMSLFH